MSHKRLGTQSNTGAASCSLARLHATVTESPDTYGMAMATMDGKQEAM